MKRSRLSRVFHSLTFVIKLVLYMHLIRSLIYLLSFIVVTKCKKWVIEFLRQKSTLEINRRNFGQSHIYFCRDNSKWDIFGAFFKQCGNWHCGKSDTLIFLKSDQNMGILIVFWPLLFATVGHAGGQKILDLLPTSVCTSGQIRLTSCFFFFEKKKPIILRPFFNSNISL